MSSNPTPWSPEGPGAAEEGAPAAGGPPSAGDALLAWGRAQQAALESHRDGVRAGSVEAVHRSRVAVRRLRVLFTTFSGLISDDRGLRRRLRRFGLSLGEARDADVWAAHLGDLLAELGPEAGAGARDALLASARERREQAARELARTWDAERSEAARSRLRDWLADPGLTPVAGLPAAQGLWPSLTAAVARVEGARAAALAEPGDPTRWHDVRKAAKAVRYGYELAAAAGVHQGRAAAWEAVTEAFGDLQDAAVSAEPLRGLREAGQGAATLDLLLDAEADRAAGALAMGREALEAALAQDGRPRA